ncbi:unnamed protein product [Spirodela intermedia]|uniref:Uncharacterized protein n=1 Tax=Spirodela intermedia TaxID=51605 RepID=A0A7I8KR94_SPIIN|nr:unnamed protein product [Spirodela intermedia]
MSAAEADVGRAGSRQAESAKFRQAERPRRAIAATSQMRDFFLGSRTSQTHLPPLRRRTPLYTGWRVSVNLVLPAGRFGGAKDTVA